MPFVRLAARLGRARHAPVRDGRLNGNEQKTMHPMASKRDYYEILEVSKDADEETIKKAYRKQAMRYHPDRNGGDKEAEARFREATEADEVLRDPETRQR